jgi:hypothetical protein
MTFVLNHSFAKRGIRLVGVIEVSGGYSFANILLQLYLLLLSLLIKYLLYIEALWLSSSLLELHILTDLATISTLVILILRVVFFCIFKLLDEDLCVDFCETGVWENWTTLLLGSLEIGFTQSVVKMAVAWYRGEDVRSLLRAASATASRNGGDWIPIRANMLVFQMCV